MSRALPLLAAALLVGVAPVASTAAELAQSPFPRSAMAPSPFTGGNKSSSSTAPAPCVGPCGSASGYGAPAPRMAYPPVESYGTPTATSYDASPRSVHVGTGASATQMLNLPRGKSAVVDLPNDARDVMVTDPKVADVVLSTPRRIYVTGISSGQTDATFVDGMGRRILHLDIRVDQDWTAASDTLAKMMPGTQIRVHAANNNLILTGDASSAGEADRALKLVGSFVDGPQKLVNLITLTGADQVMLRVKIVEVNRTILKQLGFDLNAITGQLGMPQYSLMKAPTYGVNGSYLGSLSAGYGVNTTSQPVSGFPLTNLLPGLSSGLLQSANLAGIPIGSIASVISQFLTGATLPTAQSGFVQTYLGGFLGTIQTTVTPNVNATTAGVPHTVTAASAGVTTANITQLNQAYLNGTLASLTPDANQLLDRTAFLNTFNQQLPQYNASTAYSLPAGQNSTYLDRSNPANFVATNRAGSSGLNQASSMVQAFERVGLIRTLAEPNLTAISGESGRFLVGGEFPVPVSRDLTGAISVEFKPYGVGLGYTPVVLSDGRISLKMSTEVSELTSVGAFNLATGSSNGSGSQIPTLTIPGLNVRRAETTVELPSGGALMIAGLLSSQTKQTLDSLPGLGQVPILGTLLRSRDFQNNETELVIIVTPYLVKPGRPDDFATPADGLKIATDVETNLLGKLNTGFGRSPAATAGKTYQGPYGHVID